MSGIEETKATNDFPSRQPLFFPSIACHTIIHSGTKKICDDLFLIEEESLRPLHEEGVKQISMEAKKKTTELLFGESNESNEQVVKLKFNCLPLLFSRKAADSGLTIFPSTERKNQEEVDGRVKKRSALN